MRVKAVAVTITLLGLAACAGGSKTAPSSAPSPQAVPVVSTLASLPGLSSTPDIPVPEKITTEQLNQRLNPFADPGCALPCYGGLTPGQADFQKALVFYSRLGIAPVDMVPGDFENTLDGTGHLGASLQRATDIEQALQAGFAPPRVDVALEAGVVTNVSVNWPDYPPYLTLPIVIQQLGQPDDLKLGLLFSKNPVVYLIQLIYTGKQTGFLYGGTTQAESQQLRICPDAQSITGAVIGVFATGRTPMAEMVYEKNLLPMEQSTRISYQRFVAMLVAGECLTIPASQWPQWQSLEK